jgi:hypothetical protein
MTYEMKFLQETRDKVTEQMNKVKEIFINGNFFIPVAHGGKQLKRTVVQVKEVNLPRNFVTFVYYDMERNQDTHGTIDIDAFIAYAERN